MINLTTIQGLFYYINTFKEGEDKFNQLQGLKTELKKFKYRNKNNLYIIFEEGETVQIINHDILTHKFNDLINSFNNCVFIDNGGIHLKRGDRITTFRILNYDNTLNLLFKDLDIKEKSYYYNMAKTEIVNDIEKIYYKWYTLEDGQKIYSEFLKNDIKLLPRFNKRNNYVYFNNYNFIKGDIKEINFNKDIYNINYCYCIMLLDQDGAESFILDNIIFNNKNDIENNFNDFKLQVIKDGARWNLDNSKLSYKIL